MADTELLLVAIFISAPVALFAGLRYNSLVNDIISLLENKYYRTFQRICGAAEVWTRAYGQTRRLRRFLARHEYENLNDDVLSSLCQRAQAAFRMLMIAVLIVSAAGLSILV